MDAPSSYGLNPPAGPLPKTHSPHEHPPPRPWPLAARLMLGVIMMTLTAGLALALVQLHTVTAKANLATREAAQLSRAFGLNASQTSQNGGSVTQLRSQIASLQSQLNSLPQGLAHYGVCVRTWTDNSTGNVSNIVMGPPVVKGNGVYSCPQGIYVSVIPVPGQ